jgi:hypothetical protein
MKALISPNESGNVTWVTSWKWGDVIFADGRKAQGWIPDTTGHIDNTQRVAEVEPDNKIFPVAEPLYWVDCPDNCVASQWYYKDGQVHPIPQNAPFPAGE